MNKINFKNEGNHAEIKVYGDIEGRGWFDEEREESNCTSVEDLERLLSNKSLATIDIYINSNGGSVFEGLAIYNILKRNRAYKKVYIDGFACSIASVIAMAGNQVIMPKTSCMMIHNAWCIGMGNSNEFRKLADDLDVINDVIRKAYMSKFNGSEEELINLMNAESYLNAEDCLTFGLCTSIVDNKEDTEKNVEDGYEANLNYLQNKLKQIEDLKNAIKVATEICKEEVIEDSNELEISTDEQVIEDETENVESINDKVDEVKEVNTLKVFFKLS